MNKEIYYGYLLKGDLPGAVGYVEQFPDQRALYRRVVERFAQESLTLDAVEESVLVPLFRSYGWFFLGGKTSGYYGPYVFADNGNRRICGRASEWYPDLFRKASGRLSLLDHLSFGEIGSGGLPDPAGLSKGPGDRRSDPGGTSCGNGSVRCEASVFPMIPYLVRQNTKTGLWGTSQAGFLFRRSYDPEA